VVFFTTTLVVSSLFLVPGVSATIVGVLLCFGACASLVYLAYTRAHQQWRRNKLPPLDWIWFVGLPFLSYLVLLLAGGGFLIEASLAMYAAAAGLTCWLSPEFGTPGTLCYGLRSSTRSDA
jgi:TRAP-type C4-dicarboxylate transport system permease small subunit